MNATIDDCIQHILYQDQDAALVVCSWPAIVKRDFFSSMQRGGTTQPCVDPGTSQADRTPLSHKYESGCRAIRVRRRSTPCRFRSASLWLCLLYAGEVCVPPLPPPRPLWRWRRRRRRETASHLAAVAVVIESIAPAPDDEDKLVDQSKVASMTAVIVTARTGAVVKLASDAGCCGRIAASGRRRGILRVTGRTEG